MTILDYILLGIILLTFIIGFIKGFIRIIFKLFSWAIVIGLTVVLMPKLYPTLESATIFRENIYDKIEAKVENYVGPKLGAQGDIVLTVPEGVEVNREEVDKVLEECIEKVGVPSIFSKIALKAFKNVDLTNSDLTVKEVISATTTTFVFKCLCYVLFFALLLLVITIIFFFLIRLFSFGLLSVPNRLLGALFSSLIGFFIISIIFLGISVLKGVIPLFDNMVNDTLTNGLEITKYLYNNNIILQLLSNTFDFQKTLEDVLALLTSSVKYIK